MSAPFLIGCAVPATAPATADELGFKAYNLWRMDRIGLPVPPAFVLGTEHCREYLAHGNAKPEGLRELLLAQVRVLERATGLSFGSARRPLCVSVRSGAATSMPGMMATILNVGVNATTVRGLLRLTGNPRLAWDSYRRLVQSFGEVVHQVPASEFDGLQSRHLERCGVASARDLDFEALKEIALESLDLFEERTGNAFPQNPLDQLEAAVVSIWQSWNSARAVAYRKLNHLSDDLGTAVTVQRMVYGNSGGNSGAGVAFTRDPASGEHRLYLDFAFNAQGEDVVSGHHDLPESDRLAQVLPTVFDEIARVAGRLEGEFADMQEFEFTVQEGRLFLLQTRTGKRSPWAALRIAVDQAEEGLIDRKLALRRMEGIDLSKIARARVVPSPGARVLCRATAASLGVAVGEIALDPARAVARAREGHAIILVRADAATEDIEGIAAAAGILTVAGGRTSHAAVVARQLDKVCLVGCTALQIDSAGDRCRIADVTLRPGDLLSLDGNTGEVIAGAVEVRMERPERELAALRSWGEVVAELFSACA